jgi:formate dehydrogenase iron-sulfur subunit
VRLRLPDDGAVPQDDGPVSYDSDPCIGCRYCILACPWGVPTTDWDTLKPKIHKCTHCSDRCGQPAPASRNGKTLTSEESQKFLADIIAPACVKACPADALKFGNRDEMLAEAHRRMAARPGKYVDHIYGEHEAGGTSVMYLSAVPVREARVPEDRDQGLPEVQPVRPPRRPARRHGGRRAARQHLLLHEAPRPRDGGGHGPAPARSTSTTPSSRGSSGRR